MALGGVRDGLADGVAVVAEVFSAEAGAAAAGAVDEDVAALVAFWLGGVVHFVPPHGVLILGKVLGLLELALDLLVAVRFTWSGVLCSLVCRLNAETRLLAGPSLFFSTVSILLNWTKLNCHFGWVYIFGLSDLICFSCGDLGWILGLDKLFC